jgi:hypothetical protein
MHPRTVKRAALVLALGTLGLQLPACVVNKVENYPPPPQPGELTPPTRYVVHSGTVTFSGNPGARGGAGLAAPIAGGGGQATGLPESGNTPSGLSACAADGQPNCCYPNPDDSVRIPGCAWKRLKPGTVSKITAASDGVKSITLPVSLEISVVAPDQVKSLDECKERTVGFLLSAPGLKDKADNYGSFEGYYINKDGTWKSGAWGGYSVASCNTAAGVPRDGPPPSPYEDLSVLCDSWQNDDKVKAYVAVVTVFEFVLNGKTYKWDFSTVANPDGVTAYFVVVDKAF